MSINSASAIPLYAIMEKSETYRRHMRSPGFELFFKPEVPALHRERRRVWAGLFTANGYLYHIIHHAHECQRERSYFHSLSQLMPNLERRTMELMQYIERRQSQSAHGVVDIKEVFSHWAFDYTVRITPTLSSVREFY